MSDWSSDVFASDLDAPAGLLSIRFFLRAIRGFPHPEEHARAPVRACASKDAPRLCSAAYVYFRQSSRASSTSTSSRPSHDQIDCSTASIRASSSTPAAPSRNLPSTSPSLHGLRGLQRGLSWAPRATPRPDLVIPPTLGRLPPPPRPL